MFNVFLQTECPLFYDKLHLIDAFKTTVAAISFHVNILIGWDYYWLTNKLNFAT